jgi:hypothetical protein
VGNSWARQDKAATPQNSRVEQRITNLVFTFNDRQDQILVAGVADYPVAGAEFDPRVRTGGSWASR